MGSVGGYRVGSRISNPKFFSQSLQGNVILAFESTDLTWQTPQDPKGSPPLDDFPLEFTEFQILDLELLF